MTTERGTRLSNTVAIVVELLGILWSVNDHAFWYSPLNKVYAELSLNTGDVWNSCAPSLNC